MSGRAARYRRSPDVLSREIGDEILLCRPHWDEVDRLSASGAAIWRLLAEPSTLNELTHDLAERYAVRDGDIRPDVRRFLALLVAKGLAEKLAVAPSANGHRRASAAGAGRRSSP